MMGTLPLIWPLLPLLLLLLLSQRARGGGGGSICDIHGASPRLIHDAATSLYHFGTDRLVLTLDVATLGLVNVTACDPASMSWQGFLLPSPPPPPVKTRSAVPLWQLAVASECTPPTASPIPGDGGAWGHAIDGLNSAALNRSAVVSAGAGAGTTVLTLQWVGVRPTKTLPSADYCRSHARSAPVPPACITVDVTITVSMTEGGGAATFGAFVSKRSRAGYCVQSLALPNLEWTILRDRRDKLFAPHFFGHAGDLSPADGVCGYGSCSLELHDSRASTDLYSGELNLMPNGNERKYSLAPRHLHCAWNAHSYYRQALCSLVHCGRNARQVATEAMEAVSHSDCIWAPTIRSAGYSCSQCRANIPAPRGARFPPAVSGPPAYVTTTCPIR